MFFSHPSECNAIFLARGKSRRGQQRLVVIDAGNRRDELAAPAS
jgi:hypothetical protein